MATNRISPQIKVTLPPHILERVRIIADARFNRNISRCVAELIRDEPLPGEAPGYRPLAFKSDDEQRQEFKPRNHRTGRLGK